MMWCVQTKTNSAKYDIRKWINKHTYGPLFQTMLTTIQYYLDEMKYSH